MLEKLNFLYGDARGKSVFEELQKIIDTAKSQIKCENSELWNEKDVFLITYADSFQEKEKSTLPTLSKFLDTQLKGVINGVHILPFYPYSSDRGFSIIDYFQVKKEFGNWEDIQNIAKNHRLMADLVLNHVSIKHEWFQKFLVGDPEYEDYFIWFEEASVPWNDLKKVIRSRATPLVTPFETAKGKRFVWTTYSVGDSTDQVDLNYQNPKVLLEMIKIFLSLLKKGVRVFRLDAVSGLWKELGTTCRHLPQTHIIIKLLRQIMDEICPSGLIITETTTADFEENLTYLSKDEANITYNFPLAPLILQAFYSSKTNYLTDFIKKLKPLNQINTYFNILDIHDGINIHAVKIFLPDTELDKLYIEVEKRGGKFTYRLTPEGKKIVKEMNITWWSALCSSEESFELQLKKFITSRAIAMAIKGIPAIYYLSLFGNENDTSAYENSKHARDMNRTNLDYSVLAVKLSDKTSKVSRVLSLLSDLIKKRKQLGAFDPNSPQRVLDLDSRVFALIRGERDNKVLALHNLSQDNIEIKYENKSFSLGPYSFIWEKV